MRHLTVRLYYVLQVTVAFEGQSLPDRGLSELDEGPVRSGEWY